MYSPHGFCRGLEGTIQSFAMSAFNAAQAERSIDRSGPNAVHLLGRALRRERSISTALAAELQIALDRLAQLEGAATPTRPRRSANAR